MTVETSERVRFLLTCEDCSRQYDARDLAVGSRFRCACGTTIVVPRMRTHDADVVRCSSCSAPREAGADGCSHCGSDYTLHERDLHTICPRCMTRISDRARYCHHCATPILPQGDAGAPTDRVCPACVEKQALNSRALSQGIAILECPGCAGFWLGRQAFETLLGKAREGALPESHTTAAGGELRVTRHAGPVYRRCPECDKMMHRHNFGRCSGVIIDSCRDHGDWFDAEELDRVLQWIRKGGEAATTRRDAAERRHQERQDRVRFDRLDRAQGYDAQRDRDAFGPDLFGSLLGSLFK
jgi:Zn-finger nucleic acid-binding protein